jgi:hypothetical protein
MAKKVKIKKEYVKWVAIIIIVIIAAVILWPIAKEKFMTDGNVTEVTDKSKIAELGDLVTVNYVLKLDNGKVVDTNNAELAEEAELKTYQKGPFKFILGQSNKIRTFDEAIKGLEVGENKTIVLRPIEPVLALTINMSDNRPRRILHPRVKPFKKEEYAKIFQEPALPNNIVSNIDKYPWPFKILNVTDKYVVTQIEIRAGDSVTIPGLEWQSQALRMDDKVIEFVQNPKVGLIFDTPYGTAEITNVTMSKIYFKHTPEQGKSLKQRMASGKQQGVTYDFTVLDIREEEFIIRRTNYLPQELMSLQVEVLELQKGVKDIPE